MKQSKRKKLERAGFKVGTVQEFLALSDEEMALIEMKVQLIQMLRKARVSNKITQVALAKVLGSSQSRVAKIESNASDVSIDLICKALFAIGVSRREIGRAISSKKAA